MARARVDMTQLSDVELANRERVLQAARRRANDWRTRQAASKLEQRGVTLTSEEEAAANEIINAALSRVKQLSAKDALAALIKSQEEAIAKAQREYDMPTWYGKTPVTLFCFPRYPQTRIKDNDPNRPRYQTLIDFQSPAMQNLKQEYRAALCEFQDGVRWNTQNAVGVYQPINRVLRGFKEPDYSQWTSKNAVQRINRNMRYMDLAFNSFTIPEDILTFRGIRGPSIFPRKGAAHAGNFARNFSTWQLGEIRSDPGFVSTTLSRNVADKLFTLGHDDGSTEPYVIEYRVPAGTRAVSLNAVNPGSNYASTVELLIDRDTQYKVVAIYDDRQNGRVIHRAVVDILPPAEQAGRKKLPVYKVDQVVR